MAGRLSPDELARQRLQQGAQQLEGGRRGRKKALPPWMVNDQGGPGGDDAGDWPGDESEPREDTSGDAAAAAEPDEGAGMPRRRAAKKRGAEASRKESRPAPRQRAGGKAPARAAKSGRMKAAGAGASRAGGGRAPKSRGSAARGSSPQRAGTPAARKGRTKGSGTTRKAQKKKQGR
jgi:hypothetical protein